MVAIRKPIPADAIYESGIYTVASVGGQEIDLTEALRASGYLLLSQDDLGDMEKAIEEFEAAECWMAGDDDSPSTLHLAILMGRLRTLIGLI